MSLDFSVERMKNHSVLTTLIVGEDKKWHPVTEALIFSTMPIGMNTITEKNWEEFYNRIHMLELVRGPRLIRSTDVKSSDPSNRITALEVFMHIGLSTNASNKTLNQFLKDIWANVEADGVQEIKDVRVDYLGLSLDDISMEDFQKAWSLSLEGVRPATTDSLVKQMRINQN